MRKTAKSRVSMFNDNDFFDYVMIYVMFLVIHKIFHLVSFVCVFVDEGELVKLSLMSLIFWRNFFIQKLCYNRLSIK